MKKLITLALLLSSSLAMAHLDDRDAAQVDAQREGRLPLQVLAYAKKEMGTKGCEGNNAPSEAASPIFSITKMASGSSDLDRVNPKNYSYDGLYLVIKKCPSGTTDAGAFLDFESGIYIKASMTTGQSTTFKILKKLTPDEVPNLY